MVKPADSIIALMRLIWYHSFLCWFSCLVGLRLYIYGAFWLVGLCRLKNDYCCFVPCKIWKVKERIGIFRCILVLFGAWLFWCCLARDGWLVVFAWVVRGLLVRGVAVGLCRFSWLFGADGWLVVGFFVVRDSVSVCPIMT
jgi:hypothetical protein